MGHLLGRVVVDGVDSGQVVVVGHIPVEVLLIVVHPGGPTAAVVVMARGSATPDVEPDTKWRTSHKKNYSNAYPGLN